MFYAKSTGGFYVRGIHGNNIPADAVEITNEEHAARYAARKAAIEAGRNKTELDAVDTDLTKP